MASGKLVCGVEINGSGLRVALLATKPVPTIVHCEEIPVQPGDEPRIGTLVARLLERFNARRAQVHLVFSPPNPAPGRHHIFAAPKLARAELLQVAVRELKRDGTLDPSNSYFSVDALNTGEPDPTGESKGLRYLLVALAKEPVDVAAMSMLEAKLVVRSATTTAMGLMRATQATEIPPTGIVALAQLDIRRSTLLVLENGVPRFFRDIPTSFAKGGREGADDALIAQALARELDISLVFFAQQNRPKQVDTIMIVGDAEVADRVSEWLEDSQTYKVVRFGPTDKLRVQPSVPPNLLPYASAIGATMPARKGTPSADLLPSGLRGRPERVIATAIAAALTVLIVAGIMREHAVLAEETDRQEARYQGLKIQFTEMGREVSDAASIDQKAGRADRWRDYFDYVDLYHKKLGSLIYAFERIVPGRSRLSSVTLETAGKLAPAVIKAKGNQTLSVSGVAHAQDIQLAQSDILKIFHATENMTPEVLKSSLAPLNPGQPAPTGVDMLFQISMRILNQFPEHR